jgi:hypothetical protein
MHRKTLNIQRLPKTKESKKFWWQTIIQKVNVVYVGHIINDQACTIFKVEDAVIKLKQRRWKRNIPTEKRYWPNGRHIIAHSIDISLNCCFLLIFWYKRLLEFGVEIAGGSYCVIIRPSNFFESGKAAIWVSETPCRRRFQNMIIGTRLHEYTTNLIFHIPSNIMNML